MMYFQFKCFKPRSSKLLISLFLTTFLSACAITPTSRIQVSYECERGTQLQVVFKDISIGKIRGGRNAGHSISQRVQSALLSFSDGNTIELPAQKVASGFMVSNGRYTLRGKGNEAMWAVGRMAEEKCVIATK